MSGELVSTARGPLAGVKIIEMAGIGPAPMAAMLFSELGATVVRIERRIGAAGGIERPLRFNYVLRGRDAISLDLKDPAAIEAVLELVEAADVLIEGFRPGVMERLGLSPEVCLARKPQLVYGRVTGWGQEGPLANSAGHDINYIALTGVLNAIGRAGQPPTVPVNLVGDYAGGSLYLVVGILAALHQARSSGQGQIVDAAIVDGTAHLATSLFGMLAAGVWAEERGTNLADSGAWFYDVYECADGKWISVGPLEPKFLKELLQRVGAEDLGAEASLDPSGWRAARRRLEEIFRTRPQSSWCEVLDGTDACFAPVLTMREAPSHPHLRARHTFCEIDGLMQPAPAPRFSRWPSQRPQPPQPADSDVVAALSAFLKKERIDELVAVGVLRTIEEKTNAG